MCLVSEKIERNGDQELNFEFIELIYFQFYDCLVAEKLSSLKRNESDVILFPENAINNRLPSNPFPLDDLAMSFSKTIYS